MRTIVLHFIVHGGCRRPDNWATSHRPRRCGHFFGLHSILHSVFEFRARPRGASSSRGATRRTLGDFFLPFALTDIRRASTQANRLVAQRFAHAVSPY